MNNKLTLSLKNVFSGGAKNIALTILSVIAGGIIHQYRADLIAMGLVGDIILYVLTALTTMGALAGVKKPTDGTTTTN